MLQPPALIALLGSSPSPADHCCKGQRTHAPLQRLHWKPFPLPGAGRCLWWIIKERKRELKTGMAWPAPFYWATTSCGTGGKCRSHIPTPVSPTLLRLTRMRAGTCRLLGRAGGRARAKCGGSERAASDHDCLQATIRCSRIGPPPQPTLTISPLSLSQPVCSPPRRLHRVLTGGTPWPTSGRPVTGANRCRRHPTPSPAQRRAAFWRWEKSVEKWSPSFVSSVEKKLRA